MRSSSIPILRFDDTHKRRDLSTVPGQEKYRNLITWADPNHLYLPNLVEWYAWQCSKALLIAYLQRALPIHMEKEGL